MAGLKLAEKAVTFYSWNEEMPSSVLHHISGGEAVRDSVSGKIIYEPRKEAKFNLGVYSTSDPKIIETLRGFIGRGETMTEDYNVFMSKVEDPKKRAARVSEVNKDLKQNLDAANEEIARLREQLTKKPKRADATQE